MHYLKKMVTDGGGIKVQQCGKNIMAESEKQSKITSEELEEFEIRAGQVLDEYSGENLGITQINYLVKVLIFCKKMDNSYKMPMPSKDLCKEWDINDWCDYLDATWAERGLPV